MKITCGIDADKRHKIAKQPIIVMAEIVLSQTCLFCIILQFLELNIQTLKKILSVYLGFYPV